jgi:multicomponent K+:H+ antiporter subunit F
MLDWAIQIAVLLLGPAVLLTLYRLVMGPSVPDRILALDTLYVNSAALLIVFGVATGSSLYFEGALLIAALGFIGTVALSKFILRRDIIE